MLVNDDVNLVVEFVVTSVSVSMAIRSPQDIYYTSIPSIYVQLGDAVDVLYDSIMFVRMNWYTGDSETTIRDDVMSFRHCMPGAMNKVSSDGNHMNDLITTIFLVVVPPPPPPYHYHHHRLFEVVAANEFFLV